MSPTPRALNEKGIAEILSLIEPQANGCHSWTGTITDRGYGKITVDGKNCQAHRLVFSILIGPIPSGLTLDHICHNRDNTCRGGASCLHRRCVNPEHLEPISAIENATRARISRTHCKRGHEYTESNTRWRISSAGNQIRACKDCERFHRSHRAPSNWRAVKASRALQNDN